MQKKTNSCFVRTAVGYRFKPTNEELVLHYLYNRVMGYGLSCYNAVRECDLYGDKEPWEIWEMFGGPLLGEDEDLFFFTQLKKKHNGSRIDRKVGPNGGTWHGEDSGKISKGKTFNGQVITWTQKRFCYENNNSKYQDGAWIMHEYSLNQPSIVLCRIRKNKRKGKSGEVNRQRMIQNDDDDNQTKRLKVEHVGPEGQENQQIEAIMFAGAPAMPTEFQESLGDKQAITALKKGAYLLKYGRGGKPKFCLFHLSIDESALVWHSGTEEKHLRLSDVSRIISGQCTPIFQRYPRPEKEYQSFSLIYNDRSLNLICQDKDEAEVWFSGLKLLISRSSHRKGIIESRSDGIPSEANSPRTYTRRRSPLNSPFGSNDCLQKDVPPEGFSPSDSASGSVHSSLSGGLDVVHDHMKAMTKDACRASFSSTVSSSSEGSGHDDGDTLGDVFIWGEETGNGFLGGGTHRVGSCFGVKMDSLLPKALESAAVPDVQNISCGGQHAALVTKQGEIFSWGKESGGRLGHGVDSDVLNPKLIDALSNANIKLVACGEYHTCAVTLSGDLYTWGDGTYNFGLLGHGNEVSHWVPKRVNGPLEGIHVSSISCGPWHTAVVTSAGKLFTFGYGKFGVLGHGDQKSVSIPREVESLKGLRTVRAACGVWHTAAVVEVMFGNSSSSNRSSGKLFTWGDGGEGALGHGDKEVKLVPTCVAALFEPDFCQVVCGHSLTVALTTSGHVYTMGNPVYGQLGNPQADGKLPTRVEGKLSMSFVEEIACGAYHVAVLTSKTEVYSWGKGANGRLGHGDTDDRNSPSLVEALNEKQVKVIACGTNFTAAICFHKRVSRVDQSLCSGCHLPFSFNRKQHNCDNCELVFCRSCRSKKSLKALMEPKPNKAYRVCDNCFNKLRKAIETDVPSLSSVRSVIHGPNEFVAKEEKLDSRSHAHLARFSSMESLKQAESQSTRNKNLEFNSSCVSPIPNGGFQRGALNVSKSFNPMVGSSKNFFSASIPGSRIVSQATLPNPTLAGLPSPNAVVDDAKIMDETPSPEVFALRAEVENLAHKIMDQNVVLERTTKQLKDAIAIAEDETAKCKKAKEEIKSLTSQLKDMAERLPVGAARNIESPSVTSFGSSPILNDVSNASIDHLTGQIACQEPDTNGLNNQLLSNGSSTSTNCISDHKKQGLGKNKLRN